MGFRQKGFHRALIGIITAEQVKIILWDIGYTALIGVAAEQKKRFSWAWDIGSLRGDSIGPYRDYIEFLMGIE